MDEATRRTIILRARNCCEYCQSLAAFSSGPFSVEHISPRFRGGRDTLSNLAWSCMGCNLRKATAIEAQDPVTGDVVPLFHPRQHHWTEHFAWSDDFLRVEGLTPTGRATVERLFLNRPEVINLRWALTGYGLHPPVGTILGLVTDPELPPNNPQ